MVSVSAWKVSCLGGKVFEHAIAPGSLVDIFAYLHVWRCLYTYTGAPYEHTIFVPPVSPYTSVVSALIKPVARPEAQWNAPVFIRSRHLQQLQHQFITTLWINSGQWQFVTMHSVWNCADIYSCDVLILSWSCASFLYIASMAAGIPISLADIDPPSPAS